MQAVTWEQCVSEIACLHGHKALCVKAHAAGERDKPDKLEASARVDLLANLNQLGCQRREREVFLPQLQKIIEWLMAD